MENIMRLIFTLPCLFLLSSCYLGVGAYDADYDREPYTTCSDGTPEENKKCKGEVRQLTKSIKHHTKQ